MKNLIFNDNFKFQFNEIITPAIYFSKNEIKCESPPQKIELRALLFFSVNNIDFFPTGLSFQYLKDPIILSVSPPLGPDTGGSMITIRGLNLIESESFFHRRTETAVCEFGSDSFRVPGTFSRVPGTFLRKNEDDMNLEQMNRGEVSDADVINYIHKHPIDNWRQKNNYYASHENYGEINEIFCVTPSHMSGFIKLKISANGQQYGESAFQYHFYPPESIDNIFPTSAFTTGGTQIHIIGNNFLNV